MFASERFDADHARLPAGGLRDRVRTASSWSLRLAVGVESLPWMTFWIRKATGSIFGRVRELVDHLLAGERRVRSAAGPHPVRLDPVAESGIDLAR